MQKNFAGYFLKMGYIRTNSPFVQRGKMDVPIALFPANLHSITNKQVILFVDMHLIYTVLTKLTKQNFRHLQIGKTSQ